MTLPGICWAMVKAGLRDAMQFRANFIIEVAFGLVYQTIGFAFIWIVLGRFQTIGDWTLQDVTLLYGIQLMGHALWSLSFSQIINVEGMVRMGDFDTMLIRPIPIGLQFMFSQVRVAILGDVIGAIVLLGVGLRQAEIVWSPAKVTFLVLAVIGSGLIRGAIDLVGASLVFRTLSAGYAQWMTEMIFTQFGVYPLDVFTARLRNFFTWVIPVAFVAWVPAAVLLGRTGELPVPAWVAWCIPLLGGAMMAGAWWLFLRESRRYQSTGS
ncbi:MAG: ABC-2 family transporter protein [Thermomicrobiales bacterium]